MWPSLYVICIAFNIVQRQARYLQLFYSYITKLFQSLTYEQDKNVQIKHLFH